MPSLPRNCHYSDHCHGADLDKIVTKELVMFWNNMCWKWNHSVVFSVQSTVLLQFMYNVCIHRSNALYWYLAQDIYPCGLVIQGRWVGSVSHSGLPGTGLSGNIQSPIILVSLDQMFSQYSVPFGNIPPSEYYTVVYGDRSLYCMEGTWIITFTISYVRQEYVWIK